jgi:hypothetical protein
MTRGSVIVNSARVFCFSSKPEMLDESILTVIWPLILAPDRNYPNNQENNNKRVSPVRAIFHVETD